jgi:hypothetical protein
MTSQPSGIQELALRLSPWRRRIVALVAFWMCVVIVGAVFGVQPNAPRIAAILLAIAGTSWFAIDHHRSVHRTEWPLFDGNVSNRERGNDLRVTNLAVRLELANTTGDGRVELVRDLHEQLALIIRERLHSKHGFTIEEEPRLAEGVMPPQLWTFLASLPPPDLYRPAQLDPILRRIEQW